MTISKISHQHKLSNDKQKRIDKDFNRIFQNLHQHKPFPKRTPNLGKDSKQTAMSYNKQKFMIQEKNIRKQIKKQLKVQRIISAAQGEQFQTLQSKSHIYDQKAEIQFEQKFRSELFKKRQTNRLIDKEKNDFRNFLEQPKNIGFIQYQDNLKRLKNSKIDSMMNFRRNNQQLRLLIDSGYIDNPQNLSLILDKMNSTPKLQHHQISSMADQFFGSNQNEPKHQVSENNQNEIQPVNPDRKHQQVSSQIQQMHNKMLKNTQGPQQLRNPKLLQQFFSNLQQCNQSQKQKARQDLQLMKSIKQFEATTFESRYNTLNFRFKGQVDFTWMKETQLLSYIKTQKTIDTQPQGLLTMYSQNKDKKNKFNLPIITPTVMSRIYSVCSLYDFPETDQNNRINMLNDKKYVDLQRNLFKNLPQLSDESFADAVFAYSRNHKEQQGLLNLKMSEKVMQSIWRQLKQRASSLQQEDLGLVLRSITNMSMLKNENLQWSQIMQSLSDRLFGMEKDYQIESVLSFLTLVPVNDLSIEAVESSMTKMKRYKWESKETLDCFLQCSAFLIRYKDHFSAAKSHKMIQQLKFTLASKYQQVMTITEQLSINNMPQLVSMMYYLQRSKQKEAKFEIQIPNKLVNKCKKEIVDNVRMQKQLIKQHTIGNVTMSMAMVDYCKQLAKHNNQSQQIQLSVLQMSTLKSLFCFRPMPFNSINYFFYHELIKLVSNEIPFLPVKSIAQTLFAVSLMRYKNQGIIEDVMSKIVEKIYHEIKQSQKQENIVHTAYMREYVMIVCCFHHSRVINKYYNHFVQVLMDIHASAYAKLQPNLTIRLFETIASLSFTTDPQEEQDFRITQHFSKLFHLSYQQNLKPCLDVLTKQQLLVLNYVANLFSFFQLKTNNKTHKSLELQQITKQLQKHTNKLTLEEQYLSSLTQLIQHMTRSLTNQNQNQIQIPSSFQNIESLYYQRFIPQIMDQQQQIGSQFKYQTVYENVKKKLVQLNSKQQTQPKTWRIQVPHKKEVFFIATYQHLFAKHQDENTTVKLFGFWKVYYELYALKNYNFKYVCAFLEG